MQLSAARVKTAPAVLMVVLGAALVVSAIVASGPPSASPEPVAVATTVAPVTAVGETAAAQDPPEISRSPTGEPTRITVTRGAETFVDAKMGKTTSLPSDGEWAPPVDVASWYAVGSYRDTKPGQSGVSIVGGHISWNGVPGTFFGLLDVLVGDSIAVTYDSGQIVEFRVTRIEDIDKNDATDVSTDLGREIWAPGVDVSVIRLFTCDPNTSFSDGHYAGNLVVFGDRIS